MRKKIILKSHYCIRNFYRRFFRKNKPWGKCKELLISYPEGSLGLSIGEFLEKHRIELVPQCEKHDVMHVLTNIGILLVEEIALKCYLLGNGRYSFYHLLTTAGGVLLYPEKHQYFRRHYQQGKKALPFHHIDFLELLNTPIEEVRKKYLSRFLVGHYIKG